MNKLDGEEDPQLAGPRDFFFKLNAGNNFSFLQTIRARVVRIKARNGPDGWDY
jgi:hypothetical protein